MSTEFVYNSRFSKDIDLNVNLKAAEHKYKIFSEIIIFDKVLPILKKVISNTQIIFY